MSWKYVSILAVLWSVFVSCKLKPSDSVGKSQDTSERWISRKIPMTEADIALIAARTVALAQVQDTVPEWLRDQASLRLVPEAKEAVLQLLNEANKAPFRDGDLQSPSYYLTISSGFMDIAEETSAYEREVISLGGDVCEGDRRIARPGYSEHHLGTAVDFAIGGVTSPSVRDNFHRSAAGSWLANNAHLFGFVMSYPEGKEPITGMVFQPWHYRFVGKEQAALIWKNRWSMEEYMLSMQQKNCDAVITSQQTLFMLELPEQKWHKSDWEILVQQGKALILPMGQTLVLNQLAGLEVTNPQAAFAKDDLNLASCLIDEQASGRSSAYWYRGEYSGALGYVSYLHADCTQQVLAENSEQFPSDKVEVERLLTRAVPLDPANPLANTIPVFDHPTSMNEIGFVRAASEIHAIEILEGAQTPTKPCTPMFERGIKNSHLMYRILKRGVFGRNDPLTGQKIDLNAVAEMYLSETDVIPFNYLQGSADAAAQNCKPAHQAMVQAQPQLQQLGVKKFAVRNFTNSTYQNLLIGSYVPVYGDPQLDTLVGFVTEGKNYYFTARMLRERNHRPPLPCSPLALDGGLAQHSLLLYDSERLRVHFLDAREVKRAGLWVDESFVADPKYQVPAACPSDPAPGGESSLLIGEGSWRVNDPRLSSEDDVQVYLDLNLSIPAGLVKNHGVVKIVAQSLGSQAWDIPSCPGDAVRGPTNKIYALSFSDVVLSRQYQGWRGELWLSAAYVQDPAVEVQSCPQNALSELAAWHNFRLKSFNNKMLLPVPTHLLGASVQDYHQGHYRGLSAGWDLVAPYDSPVMAMDEGRILYAGCNQGPLGCMVLYEAGPLGSGGYQYQVINGHLTPDSIKLLAPGQTVTAQSVIGGIGCTGYTNYGPHLYVQLRTAAGVPIDLSGQFPLAALEASHFQDVDAVSRYLQSPATDVESQWYVPLPSHQQASRLCQRDADIVQTWEQARAKHVK